MAESILTPSSESKSMVSHADKGGRSLPAVPVFQKQPALSTEPLQMQATAIQLNKALPEEPLQLKPFQPINHSTLPLQTKQNNTGLPDTLKSGVENLAGLSMDDVKVHYNSDKPAQLQALAYAQGSDIHIGPGQERHLPHEAWHVVQQKQGRVTPTIQTKTGVAVNDDKGLEQEADVMGAKASSYATASTERPLAVTQYKAAGSSPVQRISDADARVRLKVGATDASANGAVAVIISIHQIMDIIPLVEAQLNRYPAFALAQAGKKFPKLNTADVKRAFDGTITKIQKNVTAYIQVLEGLEDWYTDAPARDRNSEGTLHQPYWATTVASWTSSLASITTLFDQTDIVTGSAQERSGSQGLSKIFQLIDDWIKAAGGSFSAVGRATEIETTIIEKGAGDQDSMIKDNRFFESYMLGENFPNPLAGRYDVHKANLIHNISGTLTIKGGSPNELSTAGERLAQLTIVENGMSAATVSSTEILTSAPSPMDRGKGQYNAMNNTNARGYAWLLNADGWNTSNWEWLHIRAASLGGETTSANLILGLKDSNTHMMPFESNVRALANLVKDHPGLESLTVTWAADTKTGPATAKHAYENISIFWIVKPKHGATENLKFKAALASGKAIFKPLDNSTILTKAEVENLESILREFRDYFYDEKLPSLDNPVADEEGANEKMEEEK